MQPAAESQRTVSEVAGALAAVALAASAAPATARTVTEVLAPGADPLTVMSMPWAVAADPCGGLYVTGINSDVVYHRDGSGAWRQVLDYRGDGATEMRIPEGIETDAACHAVVGARGSSAVFRVGPTGVLERLLGPDGDGVHPLTLVGGVATAADGSVYASGISSNNVLRVAPGGAVSQVIDATGDGVHPLEGATAVETDPLGNVYVAGISSDNVFRIAPDGTISQIIDASGDGRLALDNPTDVAADPAGNVFVTSRNTDAVFRVAADGSVTAVIEQGGDGVSGLSRPVVVKVDAAGNAYVSGHGSSNLFRITPLGAIAELISASGDGSAAYRGPVGVTVAADGGVFTAAVNSNNVFAIAPDGTVAEILAGSELNDPVALSSDPSGNLIVSGFFSNVVRRIAADGTVSDVIGASGDGVHPLTMPVGVASDASGNVFVAGMFSENVFRIHPNGVIHQILDTTGDGVHRLLLPSALAADGSGNVYVAGAESDNVFRVRPSGHVALIYQGGGGAVPPLREPSAIAVDTASNVYVAGRKSDNVVKIAADGSASEVLDAGAGGAATLAEPSALAIDPEGVVYVAGAASNNVLALAPGGAPRVVIDAAGDGVAALHGPQALATDDRGNLFVAAAEGARVFRIGRDRVIEQVADTAGDGSHGLEVPAALALSGGRLMVAGRLSNNVLAIAPDVALDLGAAHAYFAPGAPLAFTLDLTVHAPSAQSARLNIDLVLPTGAIAPVVRALALSLPAGASGQVPFTLPLPGGAPAGDYTLVATVWRSGGAMLDQDQQAFERVTAASRGPVFTDVTAAAGLAFAQQPQRGHPNCLQPLVAAMPGAGFECMQESMAGSAAAGDYDRDGFPDLYVTRVYESDILFHNRGDGTFEDVTAAAGLGGVRQTNGAAWLDIDNDGDLDLYVSSQGENRNYLFVNRGDGTFSEEAQARGAALDTATPHWGMSIAVGDINNDGLGDIYTTDWIAGFMIPSGGESHARLLRNTGGGHFADVTVASGALIDGWPPSPYYMQISGALAFSAAMVDLDGDGWQDLAITGEMGSSRLLWNDGDGTFTDGTDAAGLATSASEMGSTFGDLDGDGDLEWVVTAISCQPPYVRANLDCSGNRVYAYEGGRKFSDRTDAMGLRIGHWGWGAALFDYDNDGDLDFVMTNGMDVPPPASNEDNYVLDPMRFFRNDGATFVSRESLVGLDDREDGKGLLVFDYDRDGDLDIFLLNTGGPPRLYRNDGGNLAGDYLRVELEGTRSNRDGLGARVSVQVAPSGPLQVREAGVATQYQGQSEFPLHFGLGHGSGTVHEVRVSWPASGAVQVFNDVPSNSTLRVVEP